MPRPELEQKPDFLHSNSLGHLEGLTFTDASTYQTALTFFGGIPYALPPVAQYRFRAPRRLPGDFRYGTKASPGRYNRVAGVCPQPGWLGPPDEKLWDENCLFLNVYIPSGEAPRWGWPVFFYIHGGFLQWGAPNFDPVKMAPLLNSAFKAIIVAPAYRLNAFGFISSKELELEAQENGEPVGNQGFWDQRLALEWVAEHISEFGGNPDEITVGGYSAGSHSTFQQLAHELYFVPDHKAIIKRAIMWSNSPGVQPRTTAQHQAQFDELLTTLDIPLALLPHEKLQRLRALPPRDIIAAQDSLQISEFRACSDGTFISKSLVHSINTGDFARRMKRRGIKLLNGECRDEHALYAAWRPPVTSTYDAVKLRLCADYPPEVVSKLMSFYCGDKKSLPHGARDWHDAFGRLYANMQVHSLERGFHEALDRGGLRYGEDVFRYRFDWRTSGCNLPTDWGVTHSSDMEIWLWGIDSKTGLTDEEKMLLRPWNEAFAKFVKGEKMPDLWRTKDVKQMVRLKEDGESDVWVDDRWDEGVQCWSAVNASKGGFLNWVRSRL
ncbi:unnamed protein product [Zymoseptoria tritici ST99CH_1A5]|uniref:Carboxylic ester hydrolase n=1 Tax=Zymoseptoria tritici ST99CH_1A5 TaxID=1276529 RepID=A0A1Y6L701_ZYMTR|nr:unnamed protein product [Zymoseptoria tritici ST99CH_1A5]